MATKHKLPLSTDLNPPTTTVQNPVEAEIRALAAKHNVVYRETETDVLAHHITRHAGDEVVLEEPSLLLIALSRAGHISDADFNRLHVAYLKANRK